MGTEQQQEQHPSLLPGLPDDIALDCLVRIPYRFHSGLRCVCRRWRDLVTTLSFYHQRRKAGAGEALVCLVQALVPLAEDAEEETTDRLGQGGDGGEIKSPKQQNNCTAPPTYGLSLYNATLDAWYRLLATTVPFFAQCAAVQISGKLVLVGGWDPATLDSVADVYIVDLVTGRRRRGAPMSAARSFFACSAVGRLVYVAGGHDNCKNALRSAEAYDPEADEWRALPSMADERDECQGLAQGGKFWVVSGYGTESQGRFDPAAECYDPATGLWSKEEDLWGGADEFGAAAAAPRSSCFALPPPAAGNGDPEEEGKLWHLECGGGRRGVREYEGKEKRWKVVGEIPESLKSSPCVTVVGGGGGGGDRVFVVGSDGEQRHKAWVMEAESRKWTQVVSPASFTGFAYSASSFLL